PANSPVEAQAPLKIDGGPDRNVTQIRQATRLLQHIELEAPRLSIHHRQAAAIDRYAIAQFHPLGHRFYRHRITPCVLALLASQHSPLFLYDSSEHLFRVSTQPDSSSRTAIITPPLP